MSPPSPLEARLERYRWLPVFLLLILPWAIHLPQWLLGLSTDPIWQNSGVVLGTRLGLFNGLPNADPDAGWTTEALGRLVALDWVHGTVPWWNPYAGVGMPLAGEMQPAAFFFPFLLLLLLKDGVLWLSIAIETVAGLATYALCRELKLGRFAALIAGALFALNGTLAWFAHGPAFPVPFLPVLLFGIERARRSAGGASGIFWIGIGICWLVVSGFPETAYIAGLFALLWGLFRFASDRPGRLAFAGRVLAGGVIGLLLAAPQLVAFIDYLGQSEIMHQYRLGTLAPSWHGFALLLMPYVYGPLTQFWGNHDLWLIWGRSGGYAGVVLPLLALRGVLPARGERPSQQGLRVFLLAWVLVAWAKMFAVPPVQGLLNHVPFLVHVDFARYAAPSWELALIVLASLALDDLARERWKLGPPLVLVLALLSFSVWLAWPGDTFFAWDRAMRARMFGLLWIALGIAATFLAFCCALRIFSRPARGRTILALAALAEAALFFAAPELNGLHPGRIDRPAIHFLAAHLGLARFYSAGPLQPNYGSYFGLAGINHATAPTPALWNRYISEKLFSALGDSLGEIFWSGASAHPAIGWQELLGRLRNYETVGVRYLLTEPGSHLLDVVALPGRKSETRLLPLAPGETATVSFPTPAPPAKGQAIEAVGLLIGTYFGTSDGTLFLRACTAGSCVAGTRPLAESVDDRMLFVPLAHPLEAKSGAALHLEIRNEAATRPVALWLAPAPSAGQATLRGPAGPIPALLPGLALRYQPAGFPLRDVYSDSVMTIWALPAPRPYFLLAEGGPCTLRSKNRRSLDATCESPAILLRRELFMPGWWAEVNGSRAAVRRSGEIFQSVSLPSGKSHVQFGFAPPGIEWAWLASLVGLLGIAFFFGLMLSEQRRRRSGAGGARSHS